MATKLLSLHRSLSLLRLASLQQRFYQGGDHLVDGPVRHIFGVQRRSNPDSAGLKSRGYDFADRSLASTRNAAFEEEEEAEDDFNAATNLWRPSEKTDARSKEEVGAWLEEHGIKMEGQNRPKPILEMDELELSSELIQNLAEFERPTPIQAITWPLALAGRNMIGIAQTGSGKTLGFMLPALSRLGTGRRKPGQFPSTVVICPTRELAQQVAGVARDYGRGIAQTEVVFGGANRAVQGSRLQRFGCDVLVGTPGRMLDFLTDGTTSIRQAGLVVLDEADRMLDMGFEPQIREILSRGRRERQTLMFSATWPKSVRELARDFIGRDPILVNVGSRSLTVNKNIKQTIIVTETYQKQKELLKLLESFGSREKVLIFCQQKKSVDWLLRTMNQRLRISCIGIHGDKTQNMRDQALDAFRSGRAQVMVATDVAARGLDIDDVTHVINYDFPPALEDYVHRIGRTGRAGNQGTAISFFTQEDANRTQELIGFLNSTDQEIPAELEEMLDRMPMKARIPRTPPTHFRQQRPPRSNYSFDNRRDREYGGSYRQRYQGSGWE